MSYVAVPPLHASGSIINYRPGGCITVGTAKSEGDYIIAPKEVWLMRRYDKGDMINVLPNKQQATGWDINPMDLYPPITFIYF